ncbi:hypothetical protein [Leptospira brenneri]|uniref:hypothetical protein n=1 Tax=Leptospira brenneri TaxID=2023182 RepID=UPI000C2A518C|nr:hypothetical protein [Leptospira brenneri]PJZ43683.1 hypothetical protein CH361_19085 [Leptospira brenneri]
MDQELKPLIEQYSLLHDLEYACKTYKKETKKDPDRLDTKVTEYWDILDKTADFTCWWSNKLKSEFANIKEKLESHSPYPK